MKQKIDEFRSVMNKGFKSFEIFAVGIYEKICELLTQIYGDSKRNKSVFTAVFALVFVLLITIFSTAISNFSVEVEPAGTDISGVASYSQTDFSSISEEQFSSDLMVDVSSIEPTTTPVMLTGIASAESSYSVTVGKSAQIDVLFTPDTAMNKAVIWTSSNDSVATVDTAGMVKGVAEGTCTITCVSAENAALAFDVTINVKKQQEQGNKYFIKVFVGSQSVVAYTKDKNGEYTVPAKIMVCSTGTVGNDTPITSFKILRKYRWKELMGPTWEQYCSSLSSSYLFHSVPYNKKNDPSSLSTGAYNALGRKASHGCIRLACADAKWIYDNCAIGTNVQIVSGSGPKGTKVPLNSAPYYAGWDPTDPNPENPYNKRPPSKTTTTTKKTTTTTTKTTTQQPTTQNPTTTQSMTTQPTTTKPTTTTTTTTTTTQTTTTEPTAQAAQSEE